MKTPRHFLLLTGIMFACPSFAPLRAALADATPANPLPVYELRIAPEEWSKLQRNPGSDDRYPAKFTAGDQEYPAGVRYRGDWARTWPKKPLKIFFEKDKDFEGRHVLNLNPNWRDPAFIREQLAYHIYAACGVPSPRTRMVRVNINGRFHGVFLEVEQPAKPFLLRSNLKGATIYKASSRSWGSDQRDLGSEAAYHDHYEKENHKDEGYRDLQSFCHELATTRNVGEFFTNHVALDEYIDYLAATALVQNWDCFNKNHFVVHDTAGSKKWLIVPWDLDRTLGDHWHGPFDEAKLPLRLGTSALPGPTGWNHLFERFFKEPALRSRLLDRIEILLQKEFTKEKLFPILDRMESELRADVSQDRQRWPNRSAGNFHAGVAGVKQYIEDRRAYLLNEIKTQRANKAAR